MQVKSADFVLCSEVRAKVQEKICRVLGDNSLEQRAIFRRIFGTSQKFRHN